MRDRQLREVAEEERGGLEYDWGIAVDSLCVCRGYWSRIMMYGLGQPPAWDALHVPRQRELLTDLKFQFSDSLAGDKKLTIIHSG